MLLVMEELTPPERVAFVLHDVFDVPFDQVAGVLGNSAAASRKLASRARKRVADAREQHIALSGAEGKWVKRWLMDVIRPPVDDAATILAHAGVVTAPIPF